MSLVNCCSRRQGLWRTKGLSVVLWARVQLRDTVETLMAVLRSLEKVTGLAGMDLRVECRVWASHYKFSNSGQQWRLEVKSFQLKSVKGLKWLLLQGWQHNLQIQCCDSWPAVVGGKLLSAYEKLDRCRFLRLNTGDLNPATIPLKAETRSPPQTCGGPSATLVLFSWEKPRVFIWPLKIFQIKQSGKKESWIGGANDKRSQVEKYGAAGDWRGRQHSLSVLQQSKILITLK